METLVLVEMLKTSKFAVVNVLKKLHVSGIKLGEFDSWPSGLST